MTTPSDGEISVALAPHYRAQGLAPYLLKRAVDYAFAKASLLRVHALVKAGNTASASAFEHAGFLLCGTTVVKGCDAVHYVCERSENANNSPTQDLAQTVGAL